MVGLLRGGVGFKGFQQGFSFLQPRVVVILCGFITPRDHGGKFEKLKDIIVDADNCIIQGVVVNILKGAR